MVSEECNLLVIVMTELIVKIKLLRPVRKL